MKQRIPWLIFGFWILVVTLGCTTDGEDAPTAENALDSVDTATTPPAEAEPFALKPGVNEISWEEELSIGTTTRDLVIHTPQSYPNHDPLPILFAFHGNAA